MRFQHYLVPAETTIESAIERLTEYSTQILLVVDGGGCLLGTVTDGDIRRAILRRVPASAAVSQIMNPTPLTAAADWSPQQAQSIMHVRGVHHIPIVDSTRRVTGVFTEESLISKHELPNTAVLMVGGLGKRLRHLTENCPKPMLKVGGKPILETTIEVLRDAGFRHFVLAANYLAEQIQDYFGDGTNYGVNIRYIVETQPLGTAGALRHIQPLPESPILVMNGDILTRVNFGHLVRYHEQTKASATMCVREFTHQIPFGVVELDGHQLTSIREKPTSSYFVNSGIYILDPDSLHYIPESGPFDMTDLFAVIAEQHKSTVAFPIREYWMDIGQPDDFAKAESEFSSHFQALQAPANRTSHVGSEEPIPDGLNGARSNSISRTQSDRFVVMSLGSIGRRHLANLRALRPSSTIAVCRLSGTSQEQALPEHADLIFHSVEEVLRFRPTAAVVAGPASTHIAVAKTLAQAGIHLLIEKPLADDGAAADSLISVVDVSDVTAMVGYSLRFLPGMLALKKHLEDGQIGRVLFARASVGQYLPDWRPSQDYRTTVSAQRQLGGGVLLELSHEIDYLIWMFGMPDRVTATGGRYSQLALDVEDMVEVLLEYDSPRKLVSVHLDMLDRAGHRECRIMGEEGTLVWDAVRDRLDAYGCRTRDWAAIDYDRARDSNKMYRDELTHFLSCVDSGEEPIIDLRQARNVLHVIEAARESMQTSQSVELAARVYE